MMAGAKFGILTMTRVSQTLLRLSVKAMKLIVEITMTFQKDFGKETQKKLLPIYSIFAKKISNILLKVKQTRQLKAPAELLTMATATVSIILFLYAE